MVRFSVTRMSQQAPRRKARMTLTGRKTGTFGTENYPQQAFGATTDQKVASSNLAGRTPVVTKSSCSTEMSPRANDDSGSRPFGTGTRKSAGGVDLVGRFPVGWGVLCPICQYLQGPPRHFVP